MLDAGKVDFSIEQGIARISFYHPKSNSLPGALLREIALKIDSASNDTSVNVVSLASSGERAFCSGASFDELLAISNLEESKHFFSGFAILIKAIKNCTKFVVTRVQGKAVGGGVGVIAASDYVLAHADASVKLSELALGFGPFIIGPAVQRKIGLNAFQAMAIDADWRDSGWAKEKGLYQETYSDLKALDEAHEALLLKLSNFNPEAMAHLKSILWEGTENWNSLLDARLNITSSLARSEFVLKTVSSLARKAN